MSISEQSSFAGRDLTLIWQESDQIPENQKISQVSAFCLDSKGQVLIIKNRHGWGLPGGHPEEGETIEESLKREIKEEADATIDDNFNLIGYVEVIDPDNDSIEGRKYLQLRFLCHLNELNDFKAEFETSERHLVQPEELPQYINWMETSVTGKAQYESFLKSLKK